MNLTPLRRFVPPCLPLLCGLLVPSLGSAACEPAALVEAFSQAGAAPSLALAPAPAPVPAMRLPADELAARPVLAQAESLLRRVGVPLAWHRVEASALELALQAGGALVVATPEATGAGAECEVLTRERRGAVRGGDPAVALWPIPDALAQGGLPAVQDAVRGMLADFRLAMRVGGQYAPQGAWVVSPWLSSAALRRSMDVEVALPGLPGSLQARADSRPQLTSAGLGLTRGLTRDTALTLLLVQQHSRISTRTQIPALGPIPAQQVDSVTRQDDTLLGLGWYSRLVREDGAVPAVIFQGRGLAPSAHIRAGGTASLTALRSLDDGWAVAASLGADAERPEAAPSRQGRWALLGASVQLSPRWMLTADAGARDVRGLPGTQQLQRLRLYRSFGSMAYLALVIDQEGPDRRATVTFARPF